ncbi:MAG: hypothetical protein ACQERC_00470 [Bacteroidota bacterium]
MMEVANAALDKLYYFYDDKVIAEISRTGEPENSVNHSDGEKLLAEVNEYIKIVEEQMN